MWVRVSDGQVEQSSTRSPNQQSIEIYRYMLLNCKM